jgi:hypothetical protein
MDVTNALPAGGGDGAVEEEEHAARQKPRTNAVKGRVMIVPFRDRKDDLESILHLALTPKADTLHLRRAVCKCSPLDLARAVVDSASVRALHGGKKLDRIQPIAVRRGRNITF